MEKLPMCRICLAEDVRMYLVVTKDLHELYERLTCEPFVTKDSRPILACYLCCAELKRSFRLLKRCLQAEELFAQIINGNYKQNRLINRFPHGFIISPIQNINIVEVGATESVVVKEELPAVCERQDDIPEPKAEYQGDDLELGNLDNSLLDVGDILPHDSEPDSKNDILVMEYKIEEEEEQEAFKEECRAVDTNRSTVAEEPKLHLRRSKSGDSIPADQMTNQASVSTVIRSTRKRTSKAKRQNITLYECFICLRVFISHHNLIRHYRTHTGEKPYKCDICQHSFSDKSGMTRHLRVHNDEKGYKCDICQMVFRRKSALRVHIRRTHTGSTVAKKPHLRRSKSEDSIPAGYKCELCQRSFTHESSFALHLCTGKKLFKCDICNSRFRRNSGLITHIRIHTGEQPYKCDVCQKSFNQSCSLRHHMRIHTGVKPYKCDMCQKNFSKNIYLTNHIRTHTGEKPYKCDICQRSFSQKVSLARHSRTHTTMTCQTYFDGKTYNYKCDICPYSCRGKGNLRRHIRKHTDQKPDKESALLGGLLSNSGHSICHEGGQKIQ